MLGLCRISMGQIFTQGLSRVFTSGCRNQDFGVKVMSKALPAPSPCSSLLEAQNCMTGLLLETDPQGSCCWVWGPQQRCGLGWESGAGSAYPCHSRRCWEPGKGSNNRLEDHCQGPQLKDLGWYRSEERNQHCQPFCFHKPWALAAMLKRNVFGLWIGRRGADGATGAGKTSNGTIQ